MRMRKKPWAEDEIRNNPQIVIPQPYRYKGKWNHYFQNDQPIHVELGTGKGRFIYHMAKKYPHINFIGMEIQTSVLGVALRRIKEAPLENIALLHVNAEHIVDLFDRGDVFTFYINFADPWPKRRHAKRRLTHRRYLEKYAHILQPDGCIHLKTDNEGLFEFSLNSFADFGCRLHRITFDLHRDDNGENVRTEYEQKFSERGMQIYQCTAYMPSGNEGDIGAKQKGQDVNGS